MKVWGAAQRPRHLRQRVADGQLHEVVGGLAAVHDDGVVVDVRRLRGGVHGMEEVHLAQWGKRLGQRHYLAHPSALDAAWHPSWQESFITHAK